MIVEKWSKISGYGKRVYSKESICLSIVGGLLLKVTNYELIFVKFRAGGGHSPERRYLDFSGDPDFLCVVCSV